MPAAASAAAPKATTGGAKGVGYGSATVDGTVNPGGEATSYYFQFGPTRAYGGQTRDRVRRRRLDGRAGRGRPHRPAAADRLPLPDRRGQRHEHRARRRSHVPDDEGAALAVDPRLAQPRALRRAERRPGHALGDRQRRRQVILEGRAFPFTTPFAQIGNPELTTATGSFSFTLARERQQHAVRGRHDDQTGRRQPRGDRERGDPGLEPPRPHPPPRLRSRLRHGHAGRGRRAGGNPAHHPRPRRAGRRARSCASTARRARASAASCGCTKASTACWCGSSAGRRSPTTASRC